MIVIIKDNEIVSVEKKLLEKTNTDLSSLSGLVNSLALQLSSLKNEKLNINGNDYEVKEIESISVENIKIFDLTAEESEIKNVTEELYRGVDIKQSQEEVLAPDEETFEIKPSIITEEHPEVKTEDETPLLQTEPTLKIDEISADSLLKKEEPAADEIQVSAQSLLKTQEPEPIQETEQIKEEKLDVLTKKEPENADEEQTHTLNIHLQEKSEEETPKTETKSEPQIIEEEKEIEISFEDDLEEIREILTNKGAFTKTVSQELQKASEELGIELKDLQEWYEQLIEQIKDEKDVIYKNINKKDYENLHRSYHKLKGAALNLRLSKIALILKKLDELSKNKENIDVIKQITDDFYQITENVDAKEIQQQNTEEQKTEEKEKRKIPAYLEDIIIQSIKNYLTSQNEEQFQKDKKYIEKLLNMKIDSIKDLESLLKDQ